MYLSMMNLGHQDQTKDPMTDMLHQNCDIEDTDKNGCWIWQAPLNRLGNLDNVIVDGVTMHPRYVAWHAMKKDLPEGGKIKNFCSNPQCVNPDHMSGNFITKDQLYASNEFRSVVAGKISEMTMKGDIESCWEWKGESIKFHNKQNPYLYISGIRIGVAKFLYEEKVCYIIGKGKHVRHTCGNAMCCNPNHIVSKYWKGTAATANKMTQDEIDNLSQQVVDGEMNVTAGRRKEISPAAVKHFLKHCGKENPDGNGCWIWTGETFTVKGEIIGGRISKCGNTVTLTEFSWRMHRGSPPRGKNVRRKCGSVLCCNPDHLYIANTPGAQYDLSDLKNQIRKMNGFALGEKS